MNEERIQAYTKLIEKLLICESGEENYILNNNQELVEPNFLMAMAVKAELLTENNEANEADFLIDLLIQLGKYLGSSQQLQTIRKETADILFDIGAQWYKISQFTLAYQVWQYTLTIYREIEDRKGEANSLNNLGSAYLSMGQWEQAIEFHQLSLAIVREIKDRQGEAHSLSNLGNIYDSLGKYEEAIKYHQQSLTIKTEIKDRKGEIFSLYNLGLAYSYLGQYERAIQYHQKGLTISKEIEDRKGEANSFNNLGNAYCLLGQYERGIEYYQESLNIKREIKDREGEASSLGNLGNAYLLLGEYERAIEYYKNPLTIAREIRDRQGEVNSLCNLGSAYHFLEQYERAIEYQQKSLTIAREIKNCEGEASSLNNLGDTYRELGQTKEAIQAFQASLAIATSETMPDICIFSGLNLGNVHFSQGNWELAITGYELSIKVIELIRNSSCTDDRRKQVLKDNLSAYSKIMQCYINLGKYEKALEYADRSRSRFLADLFHDKYLRSRDDNSLQVQEYLYLQEQIDRLRFNSPFDSMIGNHSSALVSSEATLEKIRQLGATKQEIWDNIRSENPELAAQFQPTPLSFQQMQELIPDCKTALLNFYSTKEDTFIFILRHPDAVGETSPIPLSKQKEGLDILGKQNLESGERSVVCYTCKGEGAKLQDWIWETWLDSYINVKFPEHYVAAQLFNCKPEDIETIKIKDTTALVRLTDGSQKTINISQELVVQTCQKRDQIWEEWKNKIQPTLAELSQRLQLQQVIDNYLQDIEELIIVPHLYLHQIPFAALPISPKVPKNPETTAPVLPTAGQTRDYRNFAGIDDISDIKPTPPINIDKNEYLSDRFRIRVVPSCQILDFCHQREAIKTKTVGIVENATGDLQFTPEECRQIAELYNVPPEHHLKEKQATIANYLKLAQQVNILHSSHHAGSNLSNALESGLLLSDGTLDLANLYIQSFPQLSEVFLSCCETNFTLSEITDDVLTLAGGFLTAGARTVVSTLWSVQDNSTAEFCQLYYQFRNQGETSPEALRKAQFELRKTPHFNHPFYWAAFVSQGER